MNRYQVNMSKTKYGVAQPEELTLEKNKSIETCEEDIYLRVKIGSMGRWEKDAMDRISKDRKAIWHKFTYI